jgi:diguanylate cyclase (GGDEF)-like protein
MIFKDGFHAAIVLLWVKELFALFVLVLLITQTGRLNKDYATKDDLTGAYNRREVYQVLHKEMDRAARYNKTFSIILFDVDHFKNINDTYGHIVGDNVLKGISTLVNKTIRRTDCFGRWGGEEFLLVLPETDIVSAAHIAEKICEVIRQKRFETINHVTASFGVTTYCAGRNLEDMLHAADGAMYQAKQNGRNQVVVENKSN